LRRHRVATVANAFILTVRTFSKIFKSKIIAANKDDHSKELQRHSLPFM